MGKKQETMDRIRQAALQEFGEFGYELASTNKIASKAGLSKGTIFKYFRSKPILYYAVFLNELEQMVYEMKQFLKTHESHDLLQTVVDVIFWKAAYAKDHPHATEILLAAISKPPKEIEAEIFTHLGQLSDLSMDLFFEQIPMEKIRAGYSKADVKRQFQIAVNGLQATYIKPGITVAYLEQVREESVHFLKTLLHGMEKTDESH